MEKQILWFGITNQKAVLDNIVAPGETIQDSKADVYR
jgi:hypothetical protein